MEFPGPHCQLAGISTEQLTNRSYGKIDQITNGIVLELVQHTKKNNQPFSEFCDILISFDEQFASINQSTIFSRVQSVQEKKKKLASKKKVPGIKNVSELMKNKFDASIPLKTEYKYDGKSTAVQEETCFTLGQVHAGTNETFSDTNVMETPHTHSVATQTDSDTHTTKTWNVTKHMCTQQARKLKKLTKLADKQSEKFDSLQKRVGHYSLKNINKRDETAQKNLQLLRDAQRLARKKTRDLEFVKQKFSVQREQNEELGKNISKLQCDIQCMADRLGTEVAKKVSTQKSNSKLRQQLKRLRQIQAEWTNGPVPGLTDENEHLRQQLITLTNKIQESDILINNLYFEIDELKDKLSDESTNTTKLEDGSFSDNMRLCVIQLSGLEVATEKISPVISVVSEVLFNKEFVKDDLPSSSTVQKIVDEGHYIAKTYIAERLENCINWGLSRDGTSRRKQKLLDTSVTFDTGEIASLGFTRVAKETAQSIQDVTQDHIVEMSDLHVAHCEGVTSDNFIVNSLSKLAFTMSDRASNEKLADKLLSQWRDDIIKHCDNELQIQSVKNFHCMAHVLLGFHNYICADMKSLEKQIIQDSGPLGRDNLPAFKYWSKAGTIIQRAVRTTAETFGPTGEYTGLRDRWEAYCSEKGIKSTIGNYKDNRFNGLFETSAEILVHRSDFLHVLKTVGKPNRKLQAVEADLNSKEIVTMLMALGLIYMKITGPYWNLITSGDIAYLELYPHIQKLPKYLENICERPELLAVTDDLPWHVEEFSCNVEERFYQEMKSTETNNTLLLKVIQTMAMSMKKTIEKQLVDFLTGGQFSSAADDKALQTTKFAHVTNLGCEHHFGDLDSSQRRRPNASLHHHSSVQLLKRNRNGIKKWYESLSTEDRMALWKKARKGGRTLRKKHRNQEKRVHSEIVKSMEEENQPKAKKRKVRDSNDECSEEETDMFCETAIKQPDFSLVKTGNYVIVAYQDQWYSGYVVKIDTDQKILKVKFMTPCRQKGLFMWPMRDDIQDVKTDFLLDVGIVPDCVNYGRQWSIKDSERYDELFNCYKSVYFH